MANRTRWEVMIYPLVMAREFAESFNEFSPQTSLALVEASLRRRAAAGGRFEHACDAAHGELVSTRWVEFTGEGAPQSCSNLPPAVRAPRSVSARLASRLIIRITVSSPTRVTAVCSEVEMSPVNFTPTTPPPNNRVIARPCPRAYRSCANPSPLVTLNCRSSRFTLQNR